MSLQLSPDGPGGFVNNPENSRGTLKIIFPSRYTGMITRVVAQAEDGEFRETLERVLPNESGDRERYYGSKPIDSYPDDLIVTANLLNGSSIYYVIENPQARVD
jgi:hypothetical protein